MWKFGESKILRSLLITTTIASAAGAVGAGTAVAATDAATSKYKALEEITVTSRKREEKLQDVPDSIKVLGAQQLQISNVTGLRGFVDLTPNLIVRETFRSNETFLTMRGISSAQGSLPPVAFVVDGVQYGSNDFINQDLIDIQRIEILRGPQGALYGQGAIAGAINIITKQPTNDFEGFGKLTYGNGKYFRAAGALSGPIVKDKLFARASGYYKYFGGLIYNHYLKQDVDNIDQGSGRAQLEYRGDRLKIRLQGSYTKGIGSGAFLDHAPKDAAGNWNFIDANGKYVTIDNVTDPGPDTNIRGKTWDNLSSEALKIDYDFDGFTLTSVTAHNHVLQHLYADGDYTSAPLVVQDDYFRTNVTNEELRLTSNNDGRFRWIVGGFYQHRFEALDARVGPQPADPYDLASVVPSLAHIDTETRSNLWAAFASMDYDLTNKLTATLAGRYDHDKQNSFDRGNWTGTYKEATFAKFQPKAVLSYHWTDTFMTYVSYAQGFRTGGYTQTGKFDNEVTKNYEIGFKSTLFEGLLSMSGAAYHIDYSNQQVSFVNFYYDENGDFQTARGVINIRQSRVDGMELEMSAAPTDKLRLSAGIGVSDSVALKIDPNALVPADQINAVIGNKSPFVPAFTFNLSGTYTQPVSDNLNLIFHADFRRQGGMYLDIANKAKGGAHSFISGKIALESTDGWSFAVWGKNLTDNRYAPYLNPSSGVRMPNQPRSYGVEASYRF